MRISKKNLYVNVIYHLIMQGHKIIYELNLGDVKWITVFLLIMKDENNRLGI